MIVVSDTSPLNYLLLIGKIDLLPKLFGEVYAPTAVMQELFHPHTPESVRSWATSPPEWLLIASPSQGISIAANLDPGEKDAILLALQLQAQAILIDERKGRQVANSQGLRTLGTITVLELAAEQRLIDLRTALIALRRTSFHVADNLIEAALERDSTRRLGE